MACYISSRNNRYYAAVETNYGVVAAVSAAERFGGQWLDIEQRFEEPRRRDKTGTRTYQGTPGTLRKRTRFELRTYLYGRAAGSEAPRYGALIEGAMGGAGRVTSGGLSVVQSNGVAVTFSQAHGMAPGDGLSVGGELRVVTATPDGQSVWLSAPLSGSGAGAVTGGAVSYKPAVQLAGVSIYDYWSPESAVQRILRGGVVDELEMKLNGDFHEFTFRGEAADIVDNKTFTSGDGGLSAFPAEPAAGVLTEVPAPGHLGQAWIGAGPGRLYTLAEARVRVKNNVEFRAKDFGSLTPRCIVPGEREVSVDLELYSKDEAICDEIYVAARGRSPIPLMLQMGESAGAMSGAYLPSFIPAVPEFLDGEERLRWRLKGSVAVGTGEDEIYVVFG